MLHVSKIKHSNKNSERLLALKGSIKSNIPYDSKKAREAFMMACAKDVMKDIKNSYKSKN